MKKYRLLQLILFSFFPFTMHGASSRHDDRLAQVRAWLLEDASLAEASKMPGLAAARRADLAAIDAHPPGETSPAPHEDLLPNIEHFDGNPVVEGFFQRLKSRVLDPDRRFGKGPENGKARTAEGWAFIVRADELHDLTEAFCHPQSPLAGNPDLVAPILRRLAFFAEYMAPGGPVLGDFGPCGTIADAYLILSVCHPEIIPPSLRTAMEAGIRNNAEAIIAKCPLWFQPPSPTTPCLVNSDVNLVLAIAITNRLLPNPVYADAVARGLVYIEPHILEDGATNYVGQQNECFSYHVSAVRSLTRTAQITGNDKPLEMVKRLRWYYPLSVSPTGVAEWTTAPSWHHYWNTASGADGAAVMAGLLNCSQNQRIANLGFKGNLWMASWWNPDRAAAAQPDNFTTYDRNVQGPRARYGTWSTVGTTRKTNDNRGKSSYAGCVIESGAKTGWPLDAALQDAGMEVRLNPSKDTVGEHRGRISLANAEPITTCAVGQHAAALGAVARLGVYGQPATQWITRQTWLFTPERLVGLVQIEAGAEAKAAGIFGSLFLVSGRAGWGTRKEIKDRGNGNFSYGQLQITFHGHDFNGFDHEYLDVMGGALNSSSGQKACRLLLLDDAAKSGKIVTYPKGTKHFYLVELRPASSAPAKVTRSWRDDGLLSFKVEEAGARYVVAFNPTDSPVRFSLKTTGVLHRSGEKFRADWLKEAGAVDSVPPIASPDELTVPGGEIVFLSKL